MGNSTKNIMGKLYLLVMSVCLILMFSGMSCMRDMDVKGTYASLEQKLNPLYGASSEDVGLEMGQPTYIKNIKGYELWYYYKSYGTDEETDRLAGYEGGKYEKYDKIYIYFRNNKMVKWDAHVQR